MQHKTLVLADHRPPVQLFFTRFSEALPLLSTYQSYLSSAELESAAQKATELLRQQTLLSYGLRRRALAQLLKRDPASLEFKLTAQKKPELVGHAFYFNVSHSEDYWVLAANAASPIGVDIEVKTRKVDALSIAKRFFHPEEAASIQKNPQEFWAYWTAKEAILKAKGEGIMYGLEHIVLSKDDQGKLSYEGWSLISEEIFPNTALTIAL